MIQVLVVLSLVIGDSAQVRGEGVKPVMVNTERAAKVNRTSVDWNSAERLVRERVVSSVSIDSKGVVSLYSKTTETIDSVENGNARKAYGLLQKLNARKRQSWSTYPMGDVGSMKGSCIEMGMEWNEEIKKRYERDLATAKMEATPTTYYHLDSKPNPTQSEQDSARQPAAAPDLKSKGKEKPKPESKQRSK